MLDFLLQELISEVKDFRKITIPKDNAGQRDLLRSLVNLRPPIPISSDFLDVQDQLLSFECERRDLTDPNILPSIKEQFPNSKIPFADTLVLWKGDITTLSADAIVNAANSKLLGCFIPHHRCIDNAIHSSAGIQLRLECKEIMQKQGHDEPTGQAKITKGYNLPARYVLHTVGPIIYHEVTEADKLLLASCYTACLSLAAQHHDIKSLAFCSISTGEFRFPKELAVLIAVQAVSQWQENSKGGFDTIIFNVFTDDDYEIYAGLFRES
jgi:O-acetyl-ADP-ribose deacetylase (regulator of RNase III)